MARRFPSGLLFSLLLGPCAMAQQAPIEPRVPPPPPPSPAKPSVIGSTWVVSGKFSRIKLISAEAQSRVAP